jgi:hypothetical protein
VRVEPTGSAQVEKDRFSFFRILFLIPETIPEIAEIALKARKNTPKITKIPGKFLEIDKTRTTQIKHLVLMKKILEHSNK